MKKNIYSLLACILVTIVLIQYRFSYSDIKSPYPLKITTWDALGYYMYLPGIFIYQDVTKLAWFPEIDQKYSVSGGYMYQAQKFKNDNYVFKYLGGVALLQSPFFFIAHIIAKNTDYKADGFSPPYQYAIGFGIVLYVILSLFLLRKILLRYFSDTTAAIALLLLVLATNAIQYISIDTAQSHASIFPLYVLLLYFTIKWHEQPKVKWAALTGFVIGLATICRPTESVMILIPLLWNSETKEKTREKWKKIKYFRHHLYYFVLFGFVGILPQLIYWKYATGSFVYDVGSAWDFLTPHLRVLVGWEKGWLIYTPVTIFFIVGLFYVRKYPFRKAVIYFCIINIYIIIAWRIWRYGGSYSTRALVQSYPVFALAFAALIEKIKPTKWRYAFYVLGLYLIFVNLFQIWQYNKGILHFDHMNRKYYSRIYLNPDPTPRDMSLLDTRDWLRNEAKYNSEDILVLNERIPIDLSANSHQTLLETDFVNKQNANRDYLKIETDIFIHDGLYGTYLHSILKEKNFVKHDSIRLFNPISMEGILNHYVFYVKVSEELVNVELLIYLKTKQPVSGLVERLQIIRLRR